MPEHIRALVVVLLLAVTFFHFAKRALPDILPEDTFKRWRNLWLLATVALFVSHSVWICFIVVGAVLLIARKREPHVMGLYFFLLFVLPPVPAVIGGLGIIDHFWVVDPYRLLALTLLLPTALSLAQMNSTPRIGTSPVDWLVIAYVLLMSLLAFRDGSVTGGVRSMFSLAIDILLPYFAASRSIRSIEGLRQAMAGFLIASMTLALIAVFEVMRTWRLYTAVLGAIGLSEYMYGGYLTRSGFLRPHGTVGNSIALGYVIVVGLGFWLYLRQFVARPIFRLLAVSLITLGVVASLSRGPWVGALLLVVVYVLTGPNVVSRMTMLALAFVVAIGVLSLLPKGQILVDMLPLIGDTEQENVEYRANLLRSALPVIQQNFLFGSSTFMDAPELQVMRQGEGIIDIVNSYIGVALYSGISGLLLFVGVFVVTLSQVRGATFKIRRQDASTANAGRAVFATLMAIAFIIYTVSSITAIPVVYWSVIGISIAYSFVAKGVIRPIEKPVAA